jgi:protein-tyrosine phosphatase
LIDLHCHVLPGVDDGARSLEEAVALARAQAAGGVRTIVATPHVSARYRNAGGTIARLVAELNACLAAEGVPAEIVAGAEVAAESAARIEPAELSALRLGGDGWLLLEPPFARLAPGLGDLIGELQSGGHRIVLAHPERCPAFHRDPALLEALVLSGVITSVTASSLVGRFGADVRNFALDLAHAKMLHNVASDAHDLDRRPPGIASEIERAGLGGLADWLTEEVPAAILAGTPIPRRPAIAPPPVRGRWRAPWRRRAPAVARVSRWPDRQL